MHCCRLTTDCGTPTYCSCGICYYCCYWCAQLQQQCWTNGKATWYAIGCRPDCTALRAVTALQLIVPMSLVNHSHLRLIFTASINHCKLLTKRWHMSLAIATEFEQKLGSRAGIVYRSFRCHLTTWQFCEEGGGVRFIPAWFMYFFVLHSVIFHSLWIVYRCQHIYKNDNINNINNNNNNSKKACSYIAQIK